MFALHMTSESHEPLPRIASRHHDEGGGGEYKGRGATPLFSCPETEKGEYCTDNKGAEDASRTTINYCIHAKYIFID